MRVEETIEIARSPDEVWGFVVDHANDPRWCTKVKCRACGSSAVAGAA
jgi:hypothetical protein